MSNKVNKQAEESVPTGKPGYSGGRPRSEPTRQAILAATIRLLERASVQAVSMEAIAREAGVSKATIYRWWQSKASLVIDAFVEHHIMQTPMRQDLHPAEAILTHWRLLANQYSGDAGRIVGQLLGEGQSDPDVQREFRERFYFSRRAAVLEVLIKLRESAPAVRHIDADLLMDMLYSAVYMRLIWGPTPMDPTFIEKFPISVFRFMGIVFDENGKFIEAP